MKMLIAIVNKDDSASVEEALLQAGFYITRLATTGGFLRAGNTTMLSAVEDDQVDAVLELIKTHSERRRQTVGATPIPGVSVAAAAFSTAEITVGGATVIVTPIERFVKL